MAVKLENELDFLGRSWDSATDRGVLTMQFVVNLVAVFILTLIGTIGIGTMREGGWHGVLGFVINLLGLGLGLFVFAIGAAGINRWVFAPQNSSYHTTAKSTISFLKHNWQAMLSTFAICLVVFAVIVLLLLIPVSAARVGSNFGLMLNELLYIPMILLAAAGILSLFFGTFIVPAEIAMHEYGFRRTCSSIMGTRFRGALRSLAILAVAFIPAALVALPLFVLLGMSDWLLTLLMVAVVPAAAEWPNVIMVFMKIVLLAAVLTLPVAFFSIEIGAKYRVMVQGQEEAEETPAVETEPEPEA